jgi:predicted PurR-regulated permease PerM
MSLVDRPRWPYPVKLVVSLLLLLLAIYLLHTFRVVIAPLVIAVIIAFVLSPVARLLQRLLHIPHLLAILISYLLAALVLALFPSLIIPWIASEFSNLDLDLQRILLTIEEAFGRQYHIAGIKIDTEALFEQLVSGLQGLIEPVIGQTLNLAVGVISSIIWVIFIIVVSFYLIKDAPLLSQWVEKHVPAAYRSDYLWLRQEINQIWSAFFRGQLMLALVVAVIFTGLGYLLGLPFALAMGILAGLLEFLPSIGHGIWMTVAALLAYFVGSTWLPIPNWVFMLIIIGLHMFFQQFDLNYLIPRIIGSRLHLPPLVVILGIVSGAILAGVLGIPLAAPTIASARVVGGYIYANLLDMDWPPVSATQPLPPPNPHWWKRTPRKEKKV